MNQIRKVLYHYLEQEEEALYRQETCTDPTAADWHGGMPSSLRLPSAPSSHSTGQDRSRAEASRRQSDQNVRR